MSSRMKHPITIFSFAVLGFYALFWGSQMLFPGNIAGSIILVLATIAGVVIIQPGWNIKPKRLTGYWVILSGLLIASAAIAAYFLRLLKIPLPYDLTALNILMILPGVIAVTGIEELLFRQIMFRWLEKHQMSGRITVIATSVAFAFAHLGLAITQPSNKIPFHLLQSLYMLWVGALFGEIRRATDSWAMSWIGHCVYNITVLWMLSVIK